MTKEEVLINPLILGRLNLYGLTKMHQEGFTGKGIKVGVIDRFDIEHGHNVVSCIKDELCGTAPGSTIKEYHLPEDFNWSDVVDYLKECIVDQVDIINMSIGFSNAPTELHKQVKECDSHNIFMCAAAGNEGDDYRDYVDIKLYPEEYPEVISWGSVDSDLKWSSFESHGRSIDFVGVGSNTPIRMKDGSYQLGSGTSFVSPHGAGIISCLLDKFRSRGINPLVKDVKDYMIERCVDLGSIGKDNFYGSGFCTMDIKEWHDMYLTLNGITKGKLSERVTRIENGETQEEVDKDYNIIDYQEFIATDGTVIEIPIFNLKRGVNG